MRNKPLLWIGSLIGLLLLVIATLAIYIGTRSDEWWRDQLIAALSQTLERKVVIQGDFRLDLGRIITVEADSLRINNPDWTESRDMLRLGSLRLEFDLLSVLGDTLLVNRLELADIELALEENLEGQRNWEFPVKTRPPATDKPSKGLRSAGAYQATLTAAYATQLESTPMGTPTGTRGRKNQRRPNAG